MVQKLGIILSSSNWQVCAHAHTPGGSQPDLTDRGHWNWADVQLPFDAISWLMDSGRGPDPFVGQNDRHYRWVEDVDWVLRTHFHIDDDTFAPDDELQFVMNHVDCYCDVYLDGAHLGRAQNQFREHIFDVDSLATGAEHELVLYIRSARNINSVLESAYGQLPAGFDSGRVHSRRCQVLTGWDFTPRLSSVSILTPPEIRKVDPVVLGHPHVYTASLPAVTAGQATADEATLHLSADLVSRRRASGSLHWEIVETETGRIVAEKTETITIKPKKQTISATLQIPNARLWWSAGLGDQPLYSARLSLTAKDRLENVFESATACTFGIRTLTVERRKDETGETFLPILNGVPVFCRGANWLPVSMLPSRVTSDDYRTIIAAAMGAGMNCLRVWGGGVYEHDEFYDLCDRAGILVWQDFMFACAAYPVYREFLDEVEHEAIYQVQRLRNHPSLMLWCGNSENEWLHQAGDLKKGSEHRVIGESIWSHVLKAVVEDYDPTRTYHQSSPFGKNRTDYNDMASGDRHSWNVWADWESADSYLLDNGRFISEFGVQALPALETINMIAPGASDLDNRDLSHHQRMIEGNERLVRYVAAQFAIPSDLNGWITTSQIMQARALVQAAEHWRRQRHHTAGCLIFHLNEPYPAISWSLLDHFKRPKAALLAARKVFAPVLISMELKINETPVTGVPPRFWKGNRSPVAPGLEIQGDQQFACAPLEAAVQCRFHVVNGTSLQLTGAVFVEIVAPGLETETMPGVQVTLEPNGAQVAITQMLDDNLLGHLDSLTVKARLQLDEDSLEKLDQLGRQLSARQRELAGTTELILPVDVTSGLTTGGPLVYPKYFSGNDYSPASE